MATANPSHDFVSILVVPRERFSLTEDCLEHIYAFTDVPFEVIVVDVDFPSTLAAKIEKWKQKHSNLKIVRTGRFVFPFEAKNIALEAVSPESRWIALVDSDVVVGSEWLSWLLKAAGETGSRAAHPLYLFKHKQKVSIHMADGKLLSQKRNGKDYLQPVMNYVSQNLSHASRFERMQSQFVEFHAALFHRDLIEKLKPFDDVNLAEDVHFSLRIRDLGEKIVFEPKSVITYIAGPPFEPVDLPYFRFRWNLQKGRATVDFLKKRWPIHESYWKGKLSWATYHRQRIEPYFPAVDAYQRLSPNSRFMRRIGSMIPVLKDI